MSTVVEAARYLDDIHPGWFSEINLDRLNQASISYCVLAQLYGSYESPNSIHAMGKFGSRAPFDDSTTNQTVEWRQEIKYRRYKESFGPDSEPRTSVTDNVDAASKPTLTEKTRLDILYCVDNADLELEAKDEIYKELYSF